MNVYDFDKTVYRFDATVTFFLFCHAKHPRLWLNLHKKMIWFLRYMLKLDSASVFRRTFLTF